MKKDTDTEKKIIEAATTAFQAKGYHGARMQDIADMAGINKALLHYYFRSKDKLFDEIFQRSFFELFSSLIPVIMSGKSIEDKIKDLVSTYIDFLSVNKHLPAFILHEVNHNSERITGFFKENEIMIPDIMLENFRKEIKESNLKDVNPIHFIINVISQCVFPIVAEPIMKSIFNMSDKEYNAFLQERKVILADLILTGIKK